MNTYANEQWLKDYAGTLLMNLLLAVTELPANNSGRSSVINVVQEAVNLAILNGTISVGKTLSATDKIVITEQSGDPNAWYQVQNIGYWLDGQIIEDNTVTPVEYEAQYTLIYSKNDVVRKVEGSHLLV